MGILFPDTAQGLWILRSVFYCYGADANEALAHKVAEDISVYWNEPRFVLAGMPLVFEIKGFFVPDLSPETVWYNTNAENNYIRIEPHAPMDISFVDGLGSNTGYFKTANLLQTGSTAAHEYGHTLGLDHPANLDIRGKGAPGIMYPRGTITNPEYQYDPQAVAGQKGGTLNPVHRSVTREDILALKLHRKLEKGTWPQVVGDFSSVWHEAYLPA